MRKTILLGLGRYICTAAAVLWLLWLLPRGAADVSFDALRAQVTDAAHPADTLEADAQMARRLYALDAADYDGLVLYYPATNMGAEELCLVRVKDASQLEAVQEAMQTRLDAQTNVFAGYAPEQYDLCANHSAVVTGGLDVMLVIGEGKDAAVAAFTAAHEEGGRLWR